MDRVKITGGEYAGKSGVLVGYWPIDKGTVRTDDGEEYTVPLWYIRKTVNKTSFFDNAKVPNVLEDAKVIIKNGTEGKEPTIFITSNGHVYIVTITPAHYFMITDEGKVGERWDSDGNWCGN